MAEILRALAKEDALDDRLGDLQVKEVEAGVVAIRAGVGRLDQMRRPREVSSRAWAAVQVWRVASMTRKLADAAAIPAA